MVHPVHKTSARWGPIEATQLISSFPPCLSFFEKFAHRTPQRPGNLFQGLQGRVLGGPLETGQRSAADSEPSGEFLLRPTSAPSPEVGRQLFGEHHVHI